MHFLSLPLVHMHRRHSQYVLIARSYAYCKNETQKNGVQSLSDEAQKLIGWRGIDRVRHCMKHAEERNMYHESPCLLFQLYRTGPPWVTQDILGTQL